MKKFIALFIIVFITIKVNAQLANTSWKGELNVSGGFSAVFDFKNDTLDVTSAGDGSQLETMKYSLKDSVLSLQNIYGQSQCGNTVVGTYKYAMSNDTVTLTLIADECSDRANAIGTLKLNKTK